MQVLQLGKTVSDLQSRMHDLTLLLSQESSIVDQVEFVQNNNIKFVHFLMFYFLCLKHACNELAK